MRDSPAGSSPRRRQRKSHAAPHFTHLGPYHCQKLRGQAHTCYKGQQVCPREVDRQHSCPCFKCRLRLLWQRLLLTMQQFLWTVSGTKEEEADYSREPDLMMAWLCVERELCSVNSRFLLLPLVKRTTAIRTTRLQTKRLQLKSCIHNPDEGFPWSWPGGPLQGFI